MARVRIQVRRKKNRRDAIARPGNGRAWRRLRVMLELTVLVGLLIALEVPQRLAGAKRVERLPGRVRNVELHTGPRTRPEELMAWLEADGTIVPPVDLEQVRRRLLAHPWVADAELQRRLPDTLFVQVREREPVALVLADRLMYIDAAGRPIDTADSGELGRMPLLSAARPEAMHESGAPLHRALLLLERLREQGVDPLRDISEIHLDEVGALRVVSHGSTRLVFDRLPNRSVLAGLLRLLESMGYDWRRSGPLRELRWSGGEMVYLQRRDEAPRALGI